MNRCEGKMFSNPRLVTRGTFGKLATVMLGADNSDKRLSLNITK